MMRSETGKRWSLGVAAAVLAGGFVLAALPAASAQGVAYRGSENDQSACMPDVFRLCFSDIPNERAIVACLIRSRRQLSPGCGRVFAVKPRGATAVASAKSRSMATAVAKKPKKVTKRRKPKPRSA
jgi:hypothetical protein